MLLRTPPLRRKLPLVPSRHHRAVVPGGAWGQPMRANPSPHSFDATHHGHARARFRYRASSRAPDDGTIARDATEPAVCSRWRVSAVPRHSERRPTIRKKTRWHATRRDPGRRRLEKRPEIDIDKSIALECPRRRRKRTVIIRARASECARSEPATSPLSERARSKTVSVVPAIAGPLRAW